MSDIHQTLTPIAQSLAEGLIDEIGGNASAVVATADGFSLAHVGTREIDAARVAAMASSMAALGDAISRDTSIGDTRCLVVESSRGRMVVRCMHACGEPIVVALLTDTSVLLGMAWTRMAAAEQSLGSTA